MKTFTGFVFGFRDDIDLNQRWWHRTFKVVFFVLAIPISLLAVAGVRTDEPVKLRNVEILENLRHFNDTHPHLRSTLPAFEALGNVGQVGDDGEISALYIAYGSFFCSGNMSANVAEVRDFLRTAESDYSIDDGATKAFLTEVGMNDGKAHCLGKNDADYPPQHRIVAYRMNGRATAKSWVKATGIVAIGVFLSSLILLNVYYRGLVYIICGPRRLREGHS